MLFVLASPTVVLQATTCKNDLATAFFAVAALFFAWRWREEGGRIRWAAASAISLGMCAGAKTTGVAVAGLVFVLAAWSGRGLGWRPWAGFAALAALAMVILGSLETYVNNWLGDGAWMGKPFVIEAHGNPDGLRGALASLVRYGFNSLGTGLETAASGPWLESVLTAASDGVTTALGLGTAGLSDPAQGTRFSLRCYELSSTYGLVGWIALPIAGFVLWRQRLNTAPGQLAALGFAVLLVLCVVMGWRKHNLRLLLPAALPILLSAAVVLAAFVRGRPRVRLGGTIALWALAFAVPLLARTRSPAAIRQAFTNREALSFQEQPPLLVERDAARLIAREVGANGCAVILNRGCWSLPFLLDSRQPWVVVPNRDRAPEIDMATLRHYLPPGASGRWLLLASQCHLGGEVLPPGEPRLLGKFPTGGKLYLLELSP
jgi:4-amino-4-deoxy-L-arabinose transferase-like glycosyltransferase